MRWLLSGAEVNGTIKNQEMNNFRKRILFICLLFLTLFVACKVSGQHEQRTADRQRQERIRQENRDRNKGIKAHLKRQDKSTKKRIKKTVKNQRKYYKKNAPKGKDPVKCPRMKK